MIIHSPIISGSLTFAEGATFTLPTGGVYSGSFSGSYQGATFTGGTFSGDGSSLTFGGTGIISGSSQLLTEFDDRYLNTGGDGIVSSSAQVITLLPAGTISGSSQVDGTAITNKSITIAGTSTSLGGSITAATILQGTGVVSGSSQVTPLLPAGTVSGSSQVNADNVINFDSNVKEKLDADGVISGSSQVNADTITNFDSNVKAKLNTDGVISGSSQVNLASVTGNNTSNVSEGTNLYYTDARVKTKLDSEGVVSGSSQISLSGFSTTDLSEGTNLYYTDARVKTKLNAEGVFSSSAQITITESQISDLDHYNDTDFDNRLATKSTTNLSEGTNLYYTDTRVKTKLNAEGVISGSAQITITESQISDLDHYTDTDWDNRLATKSTTNLTEGTNLYYTDARVKTKLNAEAVVSGSSQILTLVSIDEDAMTSNSDTKLPTQQSVKAYVDNKVSALVDSAPGALDTLNELAAALGDDANFSTTLSNQIAGKVSQSLEIVSGNGLTGGGNLTTNRTLAVGAGDGITVTADAVAVDGTVLRTNAFSVVSGSAQVDHDSTTNFVADEHIAHSGVSITAGNGLTGGGTIAASRTLDVVGTLNRISVSADAVDIASTYVGQTSITTLGTIGTGTWQGTAIADGYISSATAWNAKLDSAGTIATNDYAKYDASGDLVGRSYTEVKTDLSLNNVENTAVSTWAGSSNITTLGTISSGTWNGSVISSTYLDADTAHLSGTQTFSGAKTFSAAVNISNATASTTKTTGALIVTGGVGVSGALNVGGDVVAYASSDERLKDNIELISNPIEKVQSLKGVTWSWNENADELQKSLPNVGVIAQDVEKVLPQLVHDRDNGFKGVDYAKLTGLLIEAIKEQQKQIDELKSKLG